MLNPVEFSNREGGFWGKWEGRIGINNFKSRSNSTDTVFLGSDICCVNSIILLVMPF